MKIALLYPPPWKIPSSGEAACPKDGPPEDYRPGDLDADFYQIPYGLLVLGAEAKRRGHDVKVMNLSSYPWKEVEAVIGALDADLYGMSCWTANRRGVALVAEAIKKKRPDATVVIGGPHATPLAREMLLHHPAIDLVLLGEADLTFVELLERMENGTGKKGIPGSVYRDAGKILKGPSRPAIQDLDTLAPPQAYFDTHIMMTSRGCPWACTFCGAETTWGRGFRANSLDYVLSSIETVLPRLPVKMIQIKDDTFTTNKKRVVELCREIRRRKMNFFWSCDTRVDLLTEDLLVEMRLAGCQRLSLGVESGSQRILDAIDKKITVDEIVKSTELARSVGIKVRHYMMLGNRGETSETFGETLRFLDRARPHEYIFSCLSIYPGTRDFTQAEKDGWLSREEYFEGRFQELKVPFDADEETTATLNRWFAQNSGLRRVHHDTTADFRKILEKLGDYHAAHLDLGGALFHDGDLEGAERHVLRAQELGYPLPGLTLNYLACIAKARGDIDAMMDFFTRAAKTDPQHYILIRNVNAARAWFKQSGPERGLPLELEARHDFQLLERTVQPTLPGPLSPTFAEWRGAEEKIDAPSYVKTPDIEGSKHELLQRRRLAVVGDGSGS